MGPDTARRTLGVPPSANRQEVDRAFRQLVRTAHPDRGGDPEQFHRIVVARTVLARGSPVSGRVPVIVVRDAPWWHRLLEAVADYLEARRIRSDRQRRVD